MTTRLTRAFAYVSDCVIGFLLAAGAAFLFSRALPGTGGWAFLAVLLTWSWFCWRRASRTEGNASEAGRAEARMTLRGAFDILLALVLGVVCLAALAAVLSIFVTLGRP
jgi:hypothetical protein